MVLVSHSLGGLLSKMQTITTGRAVWDGVFGDEAGDLYAKVPSDNMVKQALIFDANPRVKRVVFICVPHRGSPLATGVIGAIGLSLIHLPPLVVDNIQAQIGHSLAVSGGRKGFVFPPSVHGLSPDSPLLHTLDTRSIEAPHHSIIGQREPEMVLVRGWRRAATMIATGTPSPQGGEIHQQPHPFQYAATATDLAPTLAPGARSRRLRRAAAGHVRSVRRGRHDGDCGASRAACSSPTSRPPSPPGTDHVPRVFPRSTRNGRQGGGMTAGRRHSRRVHLRP